MTPEEWTSLPWWEQRLYVEGFEQEKLVKSRDPGEAAQDLTSADIGDRAFSGFNVRRAG